MRRESNLAVRETSKEPKPSSKLKRRKNGQVVNIDRKIENRAMNILEQQEAKYRSAYRFKQPLQDKMKIIGKCLEKVLSKKQMDQYTKLSKQIQKEFSIRCRLQDHEIEGNMEKVKQYKGFLARILKKEDELANQWMLQLSQYTINNRSGVFTSDVIAREMSPKHKFIGFGALEKKQSEYQCNLQLLQEQVAKKDQIIRGLFQKMDKLGCHANIQEKCPTFGRYMQMIIGKLVKNQKGINKNYELQLSIEKQGLEITALIEQSNALKNENAKLYNDLNVAEEERQRLQKKYKDLNEEFEELVGDKIQIEIKSSKNNKELQAALQKYTLQVANTKLKLEEIVKEELQQIKNMLQYQSHSIQEELALIWNLIKDQIQHILQQIPCHLQDSYERLSEKCFNMERRYKQMLNQYQAIKEMNQESKRSYEFRENNRRKNLKCNNQFYQCVVANQKKKEAFTFVVFDIYQCETLENGVCLEECTIQTDTEVKRINQLQFYCLDAVDYIPHPKRDYQVQATITLSDLQVQTQSKNTACRMVQTVSPQLSLFSTLMNLKADPQRNVNQYRLTANHTLDYSWHAGRQTIEQGVQTEEDLFELPLVPNFVITQQEQGIDEQGIDLNNCEIIQMLKEAEGCLEFSEVELVRAELVRCKQETCNLRARISQLEKEKEEENVFNFRL